MRYFLFFLILTLGGCSTVESLGHHIISAISQTPCEENVCGQAETPETPE